MPDFSQDEINRATIDYLKNPGSVPKSEQGSAFKDLLPYAAGPVAGGALAKGAAALPKVLGMFFAAHPNIIKEAQKMSREGATRDDIWRDLNAWQGPDKFWRTEKFSPPLTEAGPAPFYIQRLMDAKHNRAMVNDAFSDAVDPDYLRDYWGIERRGNNWFFDPKFTEARRLGHDARILMHPGASNLSVPMEKWIDQPHVYDEAPWLRDMPVKRDIRANKESTGGTYSSVTPSHSPSVWINPNMDNYNPNHVLRWANGTPVLSNDFSHATGWKDMPTVTQHESVHALQDAYGWSADSPENWATHPLNSSTIKYRPDILRAWGIYHRHLNDKAEKSGKAVANLTQEERDEARKLTDSEVYWNSANEVEARNAPYRERFYESMRNRSIRGEDAARDWARVQSPWATQDVPEHSVIVGALGSRYNPRYDYKQWGVDPRSATGEPSNWGPEYGPKWIYDKSPSPSVNDIIRKRLLGE